MAGLDISEEEILSMGDKLKTSAVPISERFRILFTLRNINNLLAVRLIGEAFDDPSVLLKHELAYCLGQMGNVAALPSLNSVLENENEDPMVRHEAGEALGAIGSEESKEILSKYAKHACQEIAETCQLALQKLDSNQIVEGGVYNTNDPASSIKNRETSDSKNLTELREMLLNPSSNLYNRYQAMFTLRNIGNKDAVAALCDGLKDSSSALFRHEIAFVLGQMQSPDSTEALADCLAKVDEHEMVRHECAEALGAIGNAESRVILEKYLTDSQQVVKESVLVALDICDYEQSGTFQYANALQSS